MHFNIIIMSSDTATIHSLKTIFKQLINNDLPATYVEPAKYNHCFNRIILDWLFKACWYKHLNKNKTALHQLSRQQLELAIARMQLWLKNKALLVSDNNASLQYRKEYRQTANV